MAKLSVKTKRKTKTVRVPKSFDTKYTGPEPVFDTNTTLTQAQMGDAFNWYNYYHDYSDSRKFLVAYLKANKYDKSVIEKISNLPETIHVPTVGWVAKLLTNGYKIANISHNWFEAELDRLIDIKPIEFNVNTPRKLSIQDRLNAQFSRCVADIDDELDFFIDDTKRIFDIKKYIHDNSISGIVAQRIAKHYAPLLKEYEEVLERKDDQLREAYSKYSRQTMKKCHEFLSLIITTLGHESHKAKIMRAPRKRKAKSAEQQVAKMKYKEQDKDLNLLSVKPSDIIGASQLWVFNTKTRKLGLYTSIDIGGLKVKGSTILSYDDKASICKKVRKPEKILPTVTQGSKVALRTVMDNINAVSSPLTGRVNADTILLRIVK